MKKLLILLALATALPVSQTGCSTPPSARVVQVQTLRAVGESAKTAMDATAQLLKQNQITLAQYIRVADLFDSKFQPAYRVAVAAARSDLSTLASPDLANVALEIINLVASLTAPKPKPVSLLEKEPHVGESFIAADGVNEVTYLGNGAFITTLVYVNPYTK